MARASVVTLLSLDQYAQVMGINPWEFNQVAINLPKKNTQQCESVWYQHQWQKDFVSREELAQVILDAEELIAQHINYYPAPKYFELEEHKFGVKKVGGRNSFLDNYGRWQRIPLDYQFAQVSGTQTFTLLAADVTVTYVDRDGDSFDESFTVSDDIGVTHPAEEIFLAFKAGDRLGNAIDETWIIRPLKLSISGTTVSAEGSKSLLVDPALFEAYDAQKLDAADAATFVTEIDIYRIYYDTTNQGLAVWDPPPQGVPTTLVATAPVVVNPGIKDSGLVSVAVATGDLPYSWTPDRYQISYSAGLPLVNRKMSSKWATIVARFATTLLPTEKCGCERSNRILNFWRQIPSTGNEDSRPLTLEEIALPFGPRRGARYAWQYVKGEALDGLSL